MAKNQHLTPTPSPDNAPAKIQRDDLGRFVKGVSGNAGGRPLGSKNRTTVIKQAIEEAIVTENAENLAQIAAIAIQMALDGDKDMIKLTLGDLLREVRRVDDGGDEAARGARVVKVNISQYFGPEGKPPIEGEFHTVEDDHH